MKTGDPIAIALIVVIDNIATIAQNVILEIPFVSRVTSNFKICAPKTIGTNEAPIMPIQNVTAVSWLAIGNRLHPHEAEESGKGTNA